MTDQMTTRPIPSRLAAIVAGLELRQPTVVTRKLIDEIQLEVGSGLKPQVVIEGLVRNGWLLPLRTRGAWEFAPAAHAGRYGSADQWIEVRALLEQEPNAPVAVAFESAIWEYGHTSRQPTIPVLAHRSEWRSRPSLNVRNVSYDWKLPVRIFRGLPVWHPATVVVGVADRPAAQHDWANADEWLPEMFRTVSVSDILDEAAERENATLARLGYLSEWGGRVDIAEAIEESLLKKPLGVTYFGPRNERSRWVKRWRLYDANLPK